MRFQRTRCTPRTCAFFTGAPPRLRCSGCAGRSARPVHRHRTRRGLSRDSGLRLVPLLPVTASPSPPSFFSRSGTCLPEAGTPGLLLPSASCRRRTRARRHDDQSLVTAQHAPADLHLACWHRIFIGFGGGSHRNTGRLEVRHSREGTDFGEKAEIVRAKRESLRR